MAPLMTAMETQFGAPTSLEDFERKVQMFNYVNHRAVFEGMNAHLWAPNSGRMLWMTQPAWPSNTWQILSSDYDTQASFYGVKEACEPVHIQLNLSNYDVDVVNTTTGPLNGLTALVRVFSLDNKSLLSRDQKIDSAANSTINALKLDFDPLLANGPVIVKLELRNAAGQALSENLYWLADDSLSYRKLTQLPAATLSTSATTSRSGDSNLVRIQLKNTSNSVALMNKLTLTKAADGSRVLPAYYSDNYVSLLPGEAREINIEYPGSPGSVQVTLRGWNIAPGVISVAPGK
jgi:hypothetical protein